MLQAHEVNGLKTRDSDMDFFLSLINFPEVVILFR
jgi:hypothetical protein